MKKGTKIALFLLFLSPAMGELMSGSAPPLEFFNPFGLAILVLLYGCGTLIIREARSRWNLQWSIIFLAVAYGIIEEGLMVKSFFNPDWQDIEKLSGYGEFAGVQWSWTIMLSVYHATISTLIPIAITDALWPEYKEKQLLGRRGLKFAFAGLVLVTVFGMIFFGNEVDGKYTAYHPHPLLLVFSFLIILTLIWLAYRFKGNKSSTRNTAILPALVFGVAGFVFQAINIIVPFALVENGVHAGIALSFQLFWAAIAILFAVFQLSHLTTSTRHVTYLIFGSSLFWLVFGSIAGFAHGMLAVDIVGLGLLIWWSKTVLKSHSRGTA